MIYAKDNYEILGLSKGADEKAIKAQYRKLVKAYHPDVNGNSPESSKRFVEITNAYNELLKGRDGSSTNSGSNSSGSSYSSGHKSSDNKQKANLDDLIQWYMKRKRDLNSIIIDKLRKLRRASKNCVISGLLWFVFSIVIDFVTPDSTIAFLHSILTFGIGSSIVISVFWILILAVLTIEILIYKRQNEDLKVTLQSLFSFSKNVY